MIRELQTLGPHTAASTSERPPSPPTAHPVPLETPWGPSSPPASRAAVATGRKSGSAIATSWDRGAFSDPSAHPSAYCYLVTCGLDVDVQATAARDMTTPVPDPSLPLDTWFAQIRERYGKLPPDQLIAKSKGNAAPRALERRNEVIVAGAVGADAVRITGVFVRVAADGSNLESPKGLSKLEAFARRNRLPVVRIVDGQTESRAAVWAPAQVVRDENGVITGVRAVTYGNAEQLFSLEKFRAGEPPFTTKTKLGEINQLYADFASKLADLAVVTPEIEAVVRRLAEQYPPLADCLRAIDGSQWARARIGFEHAVLGSSPESVIDAAASLPHPSGGTLAREYDAPTGVWEGYSLRRHTPMVLGQFERYFAGRPKPLCIDHRLFRVMLALHDIGKPSVAGKSKEHNTANIRFLRALEHERVLGEGDLRMLTVVVGNDNPISACIRGRRSAEKCAAQVRFMAAEAGVPADDMLQILTTYAQCDSSAYTKNAGGLPSLDYLYRPSSEDARALAFNDALGRLEYAGPAEIRMRALEALFERGSRSAS